MPRAKTKQQPDSTDYREVLMSYLHALNAVRGGMFLVDVKPYMDDADFDALSSAAQEVMEYGDDATR